MKEVCLREAGVPQKKKKTSLFEKFKDGGPSHSLSVKSFRVGLLTQNQGIDGKMVTVGKQKRVCNNPR